LTREGLPVTQLNSQ